MRFRVCLVPSRENKLSNYELPDGTRSFAYGGTVRVDGLLYPGCSPSTAYDPLIAKLIVSAPLGPEGFENARTASVKALSEFKIQGIQTNQPMLTRILEHRTFKGLFCQSGDCLTDFLCSCSG